MADVIEAAVVPISDREVVKIVSSLAEEYSNWKPLFSTKSAALSGGVLDAIGDFDGHTIDNASVRDDDGLVVGYRRSTTENGDVAILVASDNQVNHASQVSQNRLAVLVRVFQDFQLRINASLTPAKARKVGASDRVEILRALETMHKRLIDSAIENQQRLENDFADRSKRLHAEISKLREQGIQEISIQRRKLDDENEARRALLLEDEARLEDVRKRLDDRDNTHVRRSIRESLLRLAEGRLENFVVSNATKVEYRKVLAICSVLIVALVGLAVFFGTRNTNGGEPYSAIAVYAKSALLTATAIALGFWFLKWQNRWFQRIADAELKLQQFRLDIERASWLAETVFEWRKSPDAGPYPEALLTRLSAGLFDASASREEDPAPPAAQLAQALLGSASALKLKIGDQLVEFDRRGLAKLQKPVASHSAAESNLRPGE